MISEWLGIPAAFVAWGFALYVYVVAPPTRGARFLIAMLVADGLAVITTYDNNLYVNPFLESLGLPIMQPVLHQGLLEGAVHRHIGNTEIARQQLHVGQGISRALGEDSRHGRQVGHGLGQSVDTVGAQ